MNHAVFVMRIKPSKLDDVIEMGTKYWCNLKMFYFIFSGDQMQTNNYKKRLKSPTIHKKLTYAVYVFLMDRIRS